MRHLPWHLGFLREWIHREGLSPIVRVQHRLGATVEWGIKSRRDTGYGMKISWQDRDALLSIRGKRDSFAIDSGMRDFNSK